MRKASNQLEVERRIQNFSFKKSEAIAISGKLALKQAVFV